MIWWTRNGHGFWCNFCGEILKPSFHFDNDDEWDEFADELEGWDGCPNCGAPDEFDPDAI